MHFSIQFKMSKVHDNIASQSDKMNGNLLTLVIVSFLLHSSSKDCITHSFICTKNQVIKQVRYKLHANLTCVFKQFTMHIKDVNQRAGQPKSWLSITNIKHVRKLTRMAINLVSGLHTAFKFSPSLFNESESLVLPQSHSMLNQQEIHNTVNI